MYFFGDLIEKIGPKKYRITNGGFTTCLQPTPRWNLHASTVVVNMNHYTILKEAVLNVKGVPLLFLPYLYYPTQSSNRATGFLIPTYSSNSVLGQSIHNAFFWAIDRSQDLTIQDEWFSKAGQGIGGEYRYNFGRRTSNGQLHRKRSCSTRARMRPTARCPDRKHLQHHRDRRTRRCRTTFARA